MILSCAAYEMDCVVHNHPIFVPALPTSPWCFGNQRGWSPIPGPVVANCFKTHSGRDHLVSSWIKRCSNPLKRLPHNKAETKDAPPRFHTAHLGRQRQVVGFVGRELIVSNSYRATVSSF